MKKTLSFFILVLSFSISLAQDITFNRVYEIPVPQPENCGFGNMFAGVDFDGDGKMEIYAINNMLDQGGAEYIPRIYKFEYNGVTWDSVWSHEMSTISFQNSWGALTHGDLDGDGKPELIWAPANNLQGENLNPSRIIVFEYPGDGTDHMGAAQFGGDVPNTQWSIADQNNVEIRPIVMRVRDLDGDGTSELVFADRKDLMRIGVVSVDDVPDNGTGTVNWTLEFSGEGQGILASTIYDGALLDDSFVLFHEDGSATRASYSNDSWTLDQNIPDVVPGGTWRSAMTTDIDNNGEEEIIVGGWGTGDNNVYLIYYDAFQGLITKTIANLKDYIGENGRLNGGDFGDIDQDGNIDLVFGTREATPNGAIVRLEYTGTGDFKDGANWTVQVVDSLLVEETSQRFDLVQIANVDDDPYEEILYTDGNQRGLIPIAILDPDIQVSVNDEVIPDKFFLAQNYPNPFNPSTAIRYSIPAVDALSSVEVHVSLKVYDVLGNEIATLVNENQSAGSYEINFNGAGLASGVYVYRLRTSSGLVSSKKLMLMK